MEVKAEAANGMLHRGLRVRNNWHKLSGRHVNDGLLLRLRVCMYIMPAVAPPAPRSLGRLSGLSGWHWLDAMPRKFATLHASLSETKRFRLLVYSNYSLAS